MDQERFQITVEEKSPRDFIVPVRIGEAALSGTQADSEPKLPSEVTSKTSKNVFMQAHLRSKQKMGQ